MVTLGGLTQPSEVNRVAHNGMLDRSSLSHGQTCEVQWLASLGIDHELAPNAPF